MKNFIFISPNFPMTYWKFCRELKNNGMRVLGIGDSPYDDLLQELRDSLDEYYKVSSLETTTRCSRPSPSSPTNTARSTGWKATTNTG